MTEIKLWIAIVILLILYQKYANRSNRLSTRLRLLGYGVQARLDIPFVYVHIAKYVYAGTPT